MAIAMKDLDARMDFACSGLMAVEEGLHEIATEDVHIKNTLWAFSNLLKVIGETFEEARCVIEAQAKFEVPDEPQAEVMPAPRRRS